MMPFLLKILNFQLEISVNSMFLVTEKPISTSIITAFILIIIHLLFFILIFCLEIVSYFNGFKYFLKKKWH